MKNPNKPNYPRPLPSGGFTLVELLVVITIIAVLASIVAVVLPRMMERSRAATCTGNLHQIGILMNGYAAENNGYYPSGGNPEGYIRTLCADAFASSYPNTGGQKDAPFFDKGGAGTFFMCPSDRDDVKNLYKSYLANGKIVGVKVADGTWLSKSYEPKPLAAIHDPARTFLIVEDWRRDTKLWRGNDIRYRPTSDDDDTHCHGEGRHHLFVDGHVQLIIKDPGREDSGFTVHYEGKAP